MNLNSLIHQPIQMQWMQIFAQYFSFLAFITGSWTALSVYNTYFLTWENAILYLLKATDFLRLNMMSNSYASPTEAKKIWNDRLKKFKIKLMKGNILTRSNKVYGQYLWCRNRCGFSLTLEYNDNFGYSFDKKSLQKLNSFRGNQTHDCDLHRRCKKRNFGMLSHRRIFISFHNWEKNLPFFNYDSSFEKIY